LVSLQPKKKRKTGKRKKERETKAPQRAMPIRFTDFSVLLPVLLLITLKSFSGLNYIF